MITIRRSNERGMSQYDWLESYHSFSFADYYDPRFMGFESLRVINEDVVQPARGFARHPHNNMEIITYIVSGALEHKDSMENGSVIRPGEIQRMSAGTGIEHSEHNPSQTEAVHLLQIWIIPEKKGLTPSYEQKNIPQERNKFILIGAHDKHDGAVIIHQNASLFAAYLDKGHSVQHRFENQRNGWVQLVKGIIDLNGQQLSAGDGAAIAKENTIKIQCMQDAELLLFDLA